MLAERDYCARLRASCALGMSRDETYLVANRELFERSVHDAVAMEIDLAAVGAQNEAAILRGQEPRAPSVVGTACILTSPRPWRTCSSSTLRVASKASRIAT